MTHVGKHGANAGDGAMSARGGSCRRGEGRGVDESPPALLFRRDIVPIATSQRVPKRAMTAGIWDAIPVANILPAAPSSIFFALNKQSFITDCFGLEDAS